jgi:hypothetical protein
MLYYTINTVYHGVSNLFFYIWNNVLNTEVYCSIFEPDERTPTVNPYVSLCDAQV